AIVFMTRAGPTSVEWLTPDLAKELGVAWAMIQPPRAIPIPPQPKVQPPTPPPQVIDAWSKSAKSVAPQQLPTATAPASPKLMPVVPAPPTAAPPKITSCFEPGGQQAPGTSAPPGAQFVAALAQKVVLYEEDPADPNGKRFFGWAIWRTETITLSP